MWQHGLGNLLDAADPDELIEAGVEQAEQDAVDGDVGGRRYEQLAGLGRYVAVEISHRQQLDQQLHHDGQQEALAGAKHTYSTATNCLQHSVKYAYRAASNTPKEQRQTRLQSSVKHACSTAPDVLTVQPHHGPR